MNVPRGLKRVRENWCRPFGTRSLFPPYPALTCRAITCRRFAAGFWWSPSATLVVQQELFSKASLSTRRVCPLGELVHTAGLSARKSLQQAAKGGRRRGHRGRACLDREAAGFLRRE